MKIEAILNPGSNARSAYKLTWPFGSALSYVPPVALGKTWLVFTLPHAPGSPVPMNRSRSNFKLGFPPATKP
jgi:hypothetical protein